MQNTQIFFVVIDCPQTRLQSQIVFGFFENPQQHTKDISKHKHKNLSLGGEC